MSVPIYAAYSQGSQSPFNNYQAPTCPVVLTPSTTVDSQFRPLNSSSSPDTMETSISQTPGPVPPSQTQPNPDNQSWGPQPQRNAERLRQRLTQTEAENEELRETHRLSRTDLGRVNLILDEVLDMALPKEVYEKLAGYLRCWPM